MEIEANKIKNITTTLKKILSIFPIISVGFVKILSMLKEFLYKIISDPVTNNTEKNEKIIKFKNKLKLPLFSSFSLLTYREKSPKFTIIIEKYANIVPAIEIIVTILGFEIIFSTIIKSLKDFESSL